MVSATILLMVASAVAPAQAPAPTASSGFKYIYRELDVAGRKLHGGEIIVQDGRWYRIRSIDDEVVTVDPGRGRVEVIDLVRKTRTEVTLERLEQRTATLKATLKESVAKREAKGDRANRVAAQMANDLIEPGFKPERLPGGRIVKLANESVQIEAKGEPDDNPDRVAGTGFVLAVLAKLESMRNPTRIPPFPELEAIREVAAGLKLRPIEFTYVHRLAGKPIKTRWVYEFVPSLTDREKAAIARIIQVQAMTKAQRFENYEKDKE